MTCHGTQTGLSKETVVLTVSGNRQRKSRAFCFTVLEVTADEVLAAPEAFLARAKGGREDEEVVGSSEGNRPVIERLEVRSQRWEEDGAVAVLVFRPQDEEGDA
jgi:hypothetical protein